MSTPKTIELFNHLQNSSTIDLSLIQSYVSLKQKKFGDADSSYIEMFKAGKEINTPYIDLDSLSLEIAGSSFNSATVQMIVFVHSKYFTENLFAFLSDPSHQFKLEIGIYQNGQTYTETFLISQIYSNLSFEKDYIRFEINFMGTFKTYFDFNNTNVLGKKIAELLAKKQPPDRPYYLLKDVLSCLTEVMGAVRLFEFEYDTITDPIDIMADKTVLYTLTNTSIIPISKIKMDEFLATESSLSKFISMGNKFSYYVGIDFQFDYITDFKIKVILLNSRIYDAESDKTQKDGKRKKEPMVFNALSTKQLFKYSISNNPDYASLNNYSILNSLTDEYKKHNDLEYFPEMAAVGLAADKIKENARLNLKDIKDMDVYLLEELAARFPNVNVDNIKFIAKDVRTKPSLAWNKAYGAITITSNFPFLYLRIGDLIEVQNLIQAISNNVGAKDNKPKTVYNAVYYITSIKHVYTKYKIESTIQASIVRFL